MFVVVQIIAGLQFLNVFLYFLFSEEKLLRLKVVFPLRHAIH